MPASLPIPDGPPIDYWERWLRSGPPLSKDNVVKTLIDGEEAFPEIYNVISTAVGKGHFVYLLGWYLDDAYPLIKGKAETTFFEYARQHPDVEIRVMLWREAYAGFYDLLNRMNKGLPHKPPPTNSHNNRVVRHLNTLRNVAAIADGRLPWGWSSHHQKLVVAYGSEGLIGLCGGVDINRDRIERKSDKPRQLVDGADSEAQSKPDQTPLHDVHCAVRGPAAKRLLDVFEQRWLIHPDTRSYPPLRSKAKPPSATQGAGQTLVQVVRTFNDVSSDQAFLIEDASQAESVVGYNGCIKEHSVAAAMLTMIEHARRFIYIEDQYMIDPRVAEALCKARKHVQHIIFLIPHTLISDLPEADWRRREFINKVTRTYPLKRPTTDGPSTFNVYYKGDADKKEFGPRDYIHAKTWIVDDQIALIGSANCNRRGLSSDSEVGAVIVDNPKDGFTTAQCLRMRLWASHLKLNEYDVRDPLVGAKYWDKPPSGSRVKLYMPNKDDRIKGVVRRGTIDLMIDGDFERAPKCPR